MMMYMKRMARSAVLCALLAAVSTVSFAGSGTYLAEVDPEIRAGIEHCLPMTFDRPGVLDEFRARTNSLVGSDALPKDDAVQVYDVYVPAQEGTEPLRLRVYRPVDAEGNLAGIYWIHGGGFLFGVPEQNEGLCIRFAKEVGAVVVSPDYRLAPEHPYPAALDDSYAGLVWFFDNAASLGVDEARIAVAGASAGGNLCAATVLMARDKGEVAPAFQMPLYPMIDDRFATPASHEVMDERVWNNEANEFAWKAYIGDAMGTDEATAYMAPSRAEDLSGLPPAYSCVGTLDPFRDDTMTYMARLAQAGVPTEFHLYPGAYHSFETIAPDTDYARRTVDEYIRVLKKALQP